MTRDFSKAEDWQIPCVCKGLLCSILITIVFSLSFGLLLQYTPLSENYLPSISTFVFFISMLLGSTIAAYTAGHKGLLYSTTVSFTYFLLTLLFCFFPAPSLLTFSLLLKKTFLTITSGILGGIIGIGLIPY
ncbi:MAG: TIGR04086 family membrane protein [Clostridia bacterium]|nr:TIGR04086 family membrane protein [Clostridia bacterium]